MKLFFANVIMAFLMLLSNGVDDTFFDDFLNEVNENYQIYEFIENDANTNNYYSLNIVRGYYNNEPCYGIAFFSMDAGKYKIVIEQNDTLYSLEENNRGDSFAISVKATSSIEIHIYNDKDIEQDFAVTTLLKKFDKDELVDPLTGKGKGKKFSSLTLYTSKIPYLYAFILALVVVIFVSIFIILFMVIRKKGMFNKKARKEGVANIEELIKRAKEHEDESLWGEYKPENNEILTTLEEVDENIEYIDLASYLSSKGYLADYSLMSEDDKNKLMVELMLLKNEKKISEDTYYEETYKLWKK